MVTQKCYREVKVHFKNPVGRKTDKILMLPKSIVEEKQSMKKGFSPYKKIIVGKRVCNIKKWRGY